ncbi:MAG: hypothetical protein HY319_20640 [Armatimonadetes bacterium]|nr:hypothetical protein [Armatimonadota bacterium]
MERYEQLKREIRGIQEQSRSDFAWTATAFGDVRDRMKAIQTRLESIGANSDKMHQRLLEMVDEVRSKTATREELAEIYRRLEALEKRFPAA